jgi:hypothetical protein
MVGQVRTAVVAAAFSVGVLVSSAVVVPPASADDAKTALAWSGTVSISATATSYNSNQSAPSLTALANPTLLSSGYKLAMYDQTNATLACTTSSSDSCTAPGPAPVNGTRKYVAYVLTGTPPASALPTTGIKATSVLVTITNLGYVSTTISLTASSRSYSVNDAVPTFTASVDPVVPGGYYLSVYDENGDLQWKLGRKVPDCSSVAT